jgi:predicted RNA-binding Zn-ribbon protein involved in translation (DUF1610 family)
MRKALAVVAAIVGGVVAITTIAANVANFEAQHPSALGRALAWWRDVTTVAFPLWAVVVLVALAATVSAWLWGTVAEDVDYMHGTKVAIVRRCFRRVPERVVMQMCSTCGRPLSATPDVKNHIQVWRCPKCGLLSPEGQAMHAAGSEADILADFRQRIRR